MFCFFEVVLNKFVSKPTLFVSTNVFLFSIKYKKLPINHFSITYAYPKKKLKHPFLIELGAEIKRLRIQNKLSLESLGSEVGIDGSNLQKIELGHNITLNTLLKLCICLKTSPSELFSSIKWDLTENDLDKLSITKTIAKRRKLS
jgi:DNA-binding Xre family transcriptional regulator